MQSMNWSLWIHTEKHELLCFALLLSSTVYRNMSDQQPVHFFNRAAPEVRNDGLYSRASDVFSFGIMIWEALTAQLTNLHMYKPLKPFHSLNSREVRRVRMFWGETLYQPLYNSNIARDGKTHFPIFSSMCGKKPPLPPQVWMLPISGGHYFLCNSVNIWTEKYSTIFWV